MSSNEIDPGNNQPSEQNNNIPTNDNNNNNKEDKTKDQIISELKAKLNDLKQRKKDNESLNQRYKKLLNDFSILNEAKLRLEYEIKQRETEYKRRISDLKGENEIIKSGLNDKMTNTNKIFSENDYIERDIRLKNGEINNLKDKITDLSHQIDLTQNNIKELLTLIDKLKDNNFTQNEQICKLRENNKCLALICQENEKNIKMDTDDIRNLVQKINEDNYEIQNLNGKILCQVNNIKNMQNKLECCNEMNLNMQNNIKNYEKEFAICRNENDGLKNDLLHSHNLRSEKENQNEKLKNILMEKEKQLSQLCHDNKNIQNINKDYNNNNNCYKIQNDKLRNQVKILENQNQNIIDEIDCILSEKRRINENLSNNSRICCDRLKMSVNNYDPCLKNSYKLCNNYDYNYRTNPSRYTYQRSYI